MIRTYMAERRSWLLFFVLLQLLLLFIGYVDVALPFASMLYIVFLSTLLLLLFSIVRYHRETRFYKQLEHEELPGSEGEGVAYSPFERIVTDSLESQAKRLGQAAARSETLLEQEKDELLSWIHEVKTPLTAMRLMIDRLENEALKSSLTYEWLRIHLLLDRQLHQKRLPFMENDLYMEQVDLTQLLHMELKTLQSWCMQKGIGFDVELEVEEALSDAKWLAFMLRQLLTNAVKYSDAFSDIAVSCGVQEGHVTLEIKDCGRGIEPKDLPRIFDKGFTSTHHHADGAATGMGLYLARKVADKLSIRISVRSEPGVGTTFILTFPRRNEFVRMAGM